jgi:hypothetical protein
MTAPTHPLPRHRPRSRPPLSSIASLPTVSAPVPPPPATGSPSLAQIPAGRRLPFPSELLPKLQIPVISCKSLTPSPLPSCRTSSPLPVTIGAPSPPTNAAAPKLFLRLHVVPPLGYAPPPSDLPGVTPEPHWCSRGGPCRRGPAGLAGRPRRTGYQPPWAGTQSRFPAGYCVGNFKSFSNCFK